MITIAPNTISFRRLPAQSGIYQIDWTVMQTSHNGTLEFLLSGYGSSSFAFGCDSGNYYASGASKQYFEANSPNVERTYSFIVNDRKYDVYDDDSKPLILNANKPSGYVDRVVFTASSGSAGSFKLDFKGQVPSMSVTGAIVFPIIGPYQTSIDVYNSGSVPFSILSGDMTFVPHVSGLNNLPLTVQPGSTQFISLSGQLQSLNPQSSSLSLYTDFTLASINLNFLPTTYSGSGFVYTAPESPAITFGGSSSMIFQVYNTGTSILKFTPIISAISRNILIDSGSKFFTNDRIVWSGGEFYVIQSGTGGAFNYLVNVVSGSSDLSSLDSGTYYKYAADRSFNITEAEIVSYPNENTMFTIIYDGVVSGLNMARLQLSGIGIDEIISGETY